MCRPRCTTCAPSSPRSPRVWWQAARGPCARSNRCKTSRRCVTRRRRRACSPASEGPECRDEASAPSAPRTELKLRPYLSRRRSVMKPVMKIGVGGPVGSGKTALVEKLVPLLMRAGLAPSVVANDIFTREDERILRRALEGILPADRILGVETGGCPHTAVREDPTMNLVAIEEL